MTRPPAPHARRPHASPTCRRACACSAAAVAGLLCGCGPRAPAPGPFAFHDVTAAVGIEFVHVNGAHGRRHLPETMGGSAAWFDLENDGDFDLYLGQSGALPGEPRAASAGAAVFANAGGTFTDVTATVLAQRDSGYGQGATAGDADGDGFTDVFVTNFGPDVLLVNRGARLVDETARSGLGDDAWSASAAFFDKDGDGDLDVYVANYVEYEPVAALELSPHGQGFVAYPHPDRFRPAADALFENDGSGHFVDVTAAAGIKDVAGKGLGVLAADLDLDGDQDLYVANDSTPNFLFRNDGGGHFVDWSLQSNAAYDGDGHTRAGMGIGLGDADGDGRFDLFVTNLDGEPNSLFLQRGSLVFVESARVCGLAVPSMPFVGFGTAFLDVDLDGDEDIFVLNGHIIDNVDTIQPGTPVTYRQRCLLFESDGHGTFTELGAELSADLATPRVGRALALCDVDDDLDLDALVAQNGDRAVLLRNDAARVGQPLRVRVVDGRAHDVRGARVEVAVGATVQRRFTGLAGSYCSGHDPRAFFGVAADPDRVDVVWPTGERATLRGVRAGTGITVRPDGSFALDAPAPAR